MHAASAPVAPPLEGERWLSSVRFDPADACGRPMVAVFWSHGCETSVEALRRVQILAEMVEGLVVVGVHTPRFPYEDDAGDLSMAMERHRIDVPVVHDPEYLTWNRYQPGGWPSAAHIGPEGRVLGIGQGLDGIDALSEAILAEHPTESGGGRSKRGRRRATDDRPVALSRVPVINPDRSRIDRQQVRDESTLWFPTNVTAGPEGVVAVSDTGNDRVLIGSLDPDLRTFRPDVELTDLAEPTGICFAAPELAYVVERGTGAVLQVDLDAGAIDIVVDEQLEVPTDVAVDGDGSLLVADAGLERILRITGCGGHDVLIEPLAGSGRTGGRDGRGDRSDLAQPVALGLTANGVAFVEAASSNIRYTGPSGRVRTLTGSGFYDWGLIDGPADQARFQRPGGLAPMPDGSVAVADTGNNRMRLLVDRQVRTLGLTGLRRPTGVAAVDSGHLLVADTDNHRVVVIDPRGRDAWPLAVYPATMTSIWDDSTPVL
jgi:DNA-binding beta-propeller fold protein YncE